MSLENIIFTKKKFQICLRLAMGYEADCLHLAMGYVEEIVLPTEEKTKPS